MIKIGCFITSHGFGHAARTAAVLEALERERTLLPLLFTTIHESFFSQSLHQYEYHHHQSDIGFIQNDAFDIDFKKTWAQLQNLIPYPITTLETLCRKCSGASLILCDINPIGIAVAKKLNIPSILIENFTWDWLYSSYSNSCKEIQPVIDYLKELYSSADYHIQCEPVCRPVNCDIYSPPVFRNIKDKRQKILKDLCCGKRKIVLVTTGGLGVRPLFLDRLGALQDYFFIVTGQEKTGSAGSNIQFLDRYSSYYHPDLINCADIVVCKCGYSTLAECYQTGTPTICIKRENFIESATLEAFAQSRLHATVISEALFSSGNWLDLLPEVLNHDRPQTPPANGADVIASFLNTLLTSTK